jgi:23S rRNA-/tRNA-specific pseudouridylate synthase
LGQGVFLIDGMHITVVRSVLEPPKKHSKLRAQAANVTRLHKSLSGVTNTLAAQRNFLNALVSSLDEEIKVNKKYYALCQANSMSNDSKKQRVTRFE